MNSLLFLVVTLASLSVCSAGSRGNWASGATADRDPTAPAVPSLVLTPPPPPPEQGASAQPKAPAAAAYAQAGYPPAPRGEPMVQVARATATGERPTTATYSARHGNTKYSVASATTTHGDVHTAAVA